MTAAERLDEIQARANAASDGPWEAIPDDRTVGLARVAIPESMHPSAWPDDAEFIAAARTDVPTLVAALRAALDYVDECDGNYFLDAEDIRARIAAALGEVDQ